MIGYIFIIISEMTHNYGDLNMFETYILCLAKKCARMYNDVLIYCFQLSEQSFCFVLAYKWF